MKLTLPAKVALGIIAQIAVFCAALLFLAVTSERLSEDLTILKQELEPATDDLRALVTEIKNHEDLLTTGSMDDLARVARWLPQSRITSRLVLDANALKRATTSRLVQDSAAQELSSAVALLEESVFGNRLLSGIDRPAWIGGAANPPKNHSTLLEQALSRLATALKYKREHEALGMARDLLRVMRYTRENVTVAFKTASAVRRDADHELLKRRSKASIGFVVAISGSVVAALVLLFFSIKSLRPVGDLASAVRRLAAGDYSEVSMRSSPELADLSEALNSMAENLRHRESEQERRSEEMMRTERLAVVGRMASVVAHEVRNPLNSIALNVDLLGEMLANNGKSLEVLKAVQGEVDRLADITEEYLRFGRMPKGVMAICDLTRIVRDTMDFMSGEFAGAQIKTSMDLPSDALKVVTDEGQFRQALMNILRNALEAMPTGGTLTLVAFEENDRVVLKVTDTGVGIEDSFKERLFEPFATTKARGTGLGLAFVQQAVQESSGRVSVDSNLGEGTTITLELRRSV